MITPLVLTYVIYGDVVGGITATVSILWWLYLVGKIIYNSTRSIDLDIYIDIYLLHTILYLHTIVDSNDRL